MCAAKRERGIEAGLERKINAGNESLAKACQSIQSGDKSETSAATHIIQETIELLEAVKVIAGDDVRKIVEFIEKAELVRTADQNGERNIKSSQLSKMTLFYASLAFKTNDSRLLGTLFAVLLRRNQEAIKSVKEFILAANSMHSNEKLDWHSILRIYVALCLKERVNVMRESANLESGLFFPELFQDMDKFFKIDNFGVLLGKDFQRNHIFREALMKSIHKQDDNVDLIDVLIFMYRCHVCGELLSVFNEYYEQTDKKLNALTQEVYFKFWCQTLLSQIRLLESAWEHAKTVLNGTLSFCHCSNEKTSDKSILFKSNSLCSECILFGIDGTQRVKSKSNDRVNHKGDFVMTGNINVLTVLLYTKLVPEQSFFKVSTLTDSTNIDAFDLTVKSQGSDEPESFAVWQITSHLLKFGARKQINDCIAMMMLLLTNWKNSEQFRAVKKNILKVIIEHPRIALLPQFFRIFVLLQSINAEEVLELLSELFQVLVGHLSTETLQSHSFRGKTVELYVAEFSLQNSNSDNIRIAKLNVSVIERLVKQKQLVLTLPEAFLTTELQPIAAHFNNSQQNEREAPSAFQITNKQLMQMASGFRKHDQELSSKVLDCLFLLAFGTKENGTPTNVQTQSASKASRTKQNYEFNLHTIAPLPRLLYILDVLTSGQGKTAAFWFEEMIEQIQSQRKGVVRQMCNFALQITASFTVPIFCKFLTAVFRNDKIIKNNNYLSDNAVTLASLILNCIDSPSGELNRPTEVSPKATQDLLNQVRLLTAVLDLLNHNEINLFYKDRINSLYMFISENAFAFPVAVFKPMFKLKVKIDLNFQTYNLMEISFRKNANFLSLSIIKIPIDENGENRGIAADLLSPIIKCVYAVRKMLEMLPAELFAYSFQETLLELVLKLFRFDCPQLTKEAFYSLPSFFSRHVLKVPVLYTLTDKLLKKHFGLNLLLKLSEKLLRRKSQYEFLGYLWRKYIEIVYSTLDSVVNQTSGTQRQESKLNVDLTIICLKELAAIREVDLLVLYAKSFSWLFAFDQRIASGCSDLIRQIVVSDCRLVSNNSLGFEVAKNLVLGAHNNQAICNIASLAIRQSHNLENLKGLNIEESMLNALESNSSEFESFMNSKSEYHINGIDVIMFSILLMNEESIKLTLLVKMTQVLVKLIHKKEAEATTIKGTLEDKSVKEMKRSEVIALFDCPIALRKHHTMLLFLHCLMTNTIAEQDDSFWEKRNEVFGQRANIEITKPLRDALVKRHISSIDIYPQVLLQLADRLDIASQFPNYNALKKANSKLNTRSFIDLFERDEFNKTADSKPARKQSKSAKKSVRDSDYSPNPSRARPKRHTVGAPKQRSRIAVQKSPEPQPESKKYHFRTTAKRRLRAELEEL